VCFAFFLFVCLTKLISFFVLPLLAFLSSLSFFCCLLCMAFSYPGGRMRWGPLPLCSFSVFLFCVCVCVCVFYFVAVWKHTVTNLPQTYAYTYRKQTKMWWENMKTGSWMLAELKIEDFYRDWLANHWDFCSWFFDLSETECSSDTSSPFFGFCR